MRTGEELSIASIPWLARLTPELRGQLLQGAYLQRFPAHVELVRQGDPADFLHVVVEGQVEEFSSYRDRETAIAVLSPYESFILAAVVLDRVYLKSARTLTPARILLLPADKVREIFTSDANFARSLAQELALAYRGLVKELNNQKLRSGLERLANWLVREVSAGPARTRFELPFDKKVLAARLGMAPEVLSRAFSSLAAYGVAVDGRLVTINDMDALTNLAKPLPLIDDAGV